MSDLVSRLCNAIDHGREMDPKDLADFIDAVAQRKLPVDTITLWLKAVHKHGISVKETVALTKGMMHSGAVLTWDKGRPIADKHSTGGVGDKMSLMLAPALAACGVEVPMLAGRGLGHTGGTIDKLESIPGFNCELTPSEMRDCVDEIGCCIAAQNDAIAPADGLLYAIRDVSNTVDSVPLITASIVSKKAAEGLKALVLDVKCGKAAFMKTEEQATELARSMVNTAKGLGINTIAQITEMDEPIGSHIGNALEVLNGRGTKDTHDLVALQGGAILTLLGIVSTQLEGEQRISQSLSNGTAAKRFERMCIAQGVTPQTASELLEDPKSVLESARHVTVFKSNSDGWVESIDSMLIAEVLREHGAGRFNIEDTIDSAVGCVLLTAKGGELQSGSAWCEIHHNRPISPSQKRSLDHALNLSLTKIEGNQRLIKVVE
jgi:thymidine phosphorylase